MKKHDFSWITEPLLSWYDRSARILPWRENREPYRIWVSEIMLQQTRVEAVKPYYERFLNKLPTVAALAQADEQELLKLWEGLGYYSRVRNMKKAAIQIMQERGGRFPDSPEELKKLPGIGDYTAGAIASIAFQKCAAAVDGNVLRVAARLAAEREEISRPPLRRQIEQEIMRAMPKERPGDFNQALMELGAVVCLPNGAPGCSVCPLALGCVARREGIAQKLPTKPKKKARKIQERTIFLLFSHGNIVLRKRSSTGLLAGMWELPGVEEKLSVREAQDMLNRWGIRASACQPIGEAKHVFTHIEWHMTGFSAVVRGSVPAEMCMVSQEKLHRDIALPSAFRAFLPEIEQGFWRMSVQQREEEN